METALIVLSVIFAIGVLTIIVFLHKSDNRLKSLNETIKQLPEFTQNHYDILRKFNEFDENYFFLKIGCWIVIVVSIIAFFIQGCFSS